MWLLILLLPLHLFAWTVAGHLQKAQVGDFVVYQSNRFDTLLWVSDTGPNGVVLEEITVASGLVHDYPSWKQAGAPNYSGWMTYIIDAKQGRLLLARSHLKHVQINPETCSLLNLLLATQFDQGVAQWPKDHSPLSEATILARPSPYVFPQSIEIRPKEGRRWLYRAIYQQSTPQTID